MYRSIISLGNIAYQMLVHSGRETRQQKEQLGWRLEVTGNMKATEKREGWMKFEKKGGGRQYRGFFKDKIEGG